MNDKTLNARTQQLYALVYVHPYKDELLDIMYQQQLDDTDMCIKWHDE